MAAFVAFLLPAAAANASGNVDVGQRAGILADDFDFLPVPRGAQSPWALVEDATAAGGVALEQRGAPTYANHSLAVYKPVSVTDAEISVRIKATGGREDQGGGIALRLTAPDSYYLVEMDARRDRVVFLRVANGSADELISIDADIAAKAWHTLRVRAVDDEFVVSLDGVWAFTDVRQDFAARRARRALDRHRQRHALRQPRDRTAFAVSATLVTPKKRSTPRKDKDHA